MEENAYLHLPKEGGGKDEHLLSTNYVLVIGRHIYIHSHNLTTSEQLNEG